MRARYYIDIRERTYPDAGMKERETYLEIIAAGSREVVTVIEVLSRTNKLSAGGGRQEYRAKQDEVIAGGVNLVEIDLLRQGTRVVMASPGERLLLPRFDYLACVSRAEERPNVEVYAFTVRDRLPRIAVPLRSPDADAVLDLPAVFARCYDAADYSLRVDYNEPPPEPLRPEDEAWADALLRAAGLRGA